jgi:predicted ATPase
LSSVRHQPGQRRAAWAHRYNTTVLSFAGWREIHTLDDERKMDFESANRFGQHVAGTCRNLGYAIAEVPRLPTFVVDVIQGRPGN